ncbi:MAG: carboxypeptidase regulatory-like domain-containing protein, partial [Chitinophagaceae bacterium]
MKKIFTLSLHLFTLFITAQAQKADGSIKGKLVDSTTKQPISDATVSLLNAKDSSLATFTLSNKQGVFEIKGLAANSYQLIISHKSYDPISQFITISAAQKNIDLGSLNPGTGGKSLENVTIISSVPISIKDDT